VFDGDFGHADKGGRVLHTASIHIRTENGDGRVVGSAEGFETFVALLAVVEAWGHAVDAEVWGGDEGGGGPFSGLFGVGGFDVAVDWEDGLLEVWTREQKRWLVWYTFTDLETNVVPVCSSESAIMAGYDDGRDGGVIPMVLTGGGGNEVAIVNVISIVG
jgi:hypothetical protein